MRRRKVHFTIPPKVSVIYRVIDGKDTKVTIIRDSWLCKVLRRPTLSLWTRIYVRDVVLPKKLFERELRILYTQRLMGKWKTIWRLLSGRS